MGDIAIVWDPSTGTGDFAMSGAGLLLGNDLETAVLISLFTDAPAEPGDPAYDASDDPRGWWADTYSAQEDASLTPIPGDVTGSKLWQALNMPRTQATLNWAADQATKALTWMQTDGVASSVSAQAYFTAPGGIGIVATIVRPDGTANKYDYAWGQVGS